MAFGDANTQIQKLEKQIEFRDYQIKKLSQYYTKLQIIHQNYINESSVIQLDKKLKTEDIKQKIDTNYKINNNCVTKKEFVNNIKKKNKHIEKNEKFLSNSMKKNVKKFRKNGKILIKSNKKKLPIIKYETIKSSTVMFNSLFHETVRLNQVCNF